MRVVLAVVVACALACCAAHGATNEDTDAKPHCAFAPPVPSPEDTAHPCNVASCKEDEFGPECERAVVRFCFEMGRGKDNAACRTYSGSCDALFTATTPPPLHRAPTNNATVQRLSIARRPLYTPCSERSCGDVFSEDCTRAMITFCSSNTTRTHPGCAMLHALCPLPKPTVGSWACASAACVRDPRGEGCLDAMRRQCERVMEGGDGEGGVVDEADEAVVFCHAFVTTGAAAAEEGETLTPTQLWLLDQANPSAAAQYNADVTTRNAERNRLLAAGLPLHPSTNQDSHPPLMVPSRA